MRTFRGGHFLRATLPFGAAAGLVAFAHNALLRPYGGNLLATVMPYCLLRNRWAALLVSCSEPLQTPRKREPLRGVYGSTFPA